MNADPAQPQSDDILPEYDLSKMSFVRGKHAHLVGQPHTVTIHKGDGTATVQKFDGAGNMTSEKHNVWIGDRIAGDKVAGDKVMGNKVQIATVQGDAVAGNKIVNANTAELLQLVATMRQAATQFPKEIQDDIIIDIDDVEIEIQKPESDRNLPKLKKRLIALATAGSLIAAPIAGMTDFVNNVTDLATKVGIELPFNVIP
jgi:hypothetical protein